MMDEAEKEYKKMSQRIYESQEAMKVPQSKNPTCTNVSMIVIFSVPKSSLCFIVF